MTEAGRNNLSTLVALASASGSGATAAANLQVVLDYLATQGITTGAAVDYLKSKMLELANGVQYDATDATLGLSDVMSLVSQGMNKYASSAKKASNSTSQYDDEIDDLENKISDLEDEIDSLNDALDKQQDILDKSTWTTQDYADAVKTLWDSMFDAYTGKVDALQAIADGWSDIGKSVDDATASIREARATLAGLESDRTILEYWRSVAAMYGDDTRVAAIDALLEENSSSIQAAKDEIVSAQNEISDATSDAALMDMVAAYADYINILAQSGISGGDLQDQISSLASAFAKQAKAAGFTADQVSDATSILKAYSDAAELVPDAEINITWKYNGRGYGSLSDAASVINSALANWMLGNKDFALEMGMVYPGSRSVDKTNGFAAYWDKQVAAFNEKNRLEAQITFSENKKAGYQDALDRYNDLKNKEVKVTYSSDMSPALKNYDDYLENVALIAKYTERIKLGGSSATLDHYGALISALTAKNRAMGYAQGGYTGNGQSDDVAGVAHYGEFIFPKYAVNQATGYPKAEYLAGIASMAGNTYNYGNTGAVSLSAGTIQALAQLLQQYIVVDGQVLATTTSKAYSQSTSIGAN